VKLPNWDRATVPDSKIRDYLLSPTHRDGRFKAAFFTRFGFTRDDWVILADALLQHAREHEIAREESSPFGTRYVIEGPLHSPEGRSPPVRTVWFIETGEDVPRFITAYPL
jgi:uncharacterized protein DUF6883